MNGRSFSISDLVSSCQSGSPVEKHLDLCQVETISVNVTNTGNTMSDYVALLFVSGEFGPRPYPLKTLVAYTRAHDIAGGTSQTANLNLTLGGLSRVDKDGNTVLYPGDYSLQLDVLPLLEVSFKLVGEPVVLDHWPQPRANGKPIVQPAAGRDGVVHGQQDLLSLGTQKQLVG